MSAGPPVSGADPGPSDCTRCPVASIAIRGTAVNRSISRLVALTALVASALLVGCSPETQAEFANRTSDTTPYLIAGMSASDPGNATGGVETGPTFHRLPITLDAPDPNQGDSPFTVDVDKSLAGVKTGGLTDAGLAAALQDEVQPMATKRKAVVYNPQQIRTAYGLPSVPASITGLSADARAALGAGQTIYIVVAGHKPIAPCIDGRSQDRSVFGHDLRG
jgi:hypothetical protein